MNFKKSWKRANDGFTLVELIVVIAILAILAGIAVPAYSGYIKKANKAADLQLLGAVNTAFAAAALENGDDVNTLTSASLSTTPSGDGFVVTGVSSPAEYNEAFQRYYAGNSGVFKAITGLRFANGVFVDVMDTALSAPMNKLLQNLIGNYSDDIDAMNNGNSFVAGMGVPGMLGKVDEVTDFAALMSGSEKMNKVFTSPEFLQMAAEAMGIDVNDPEIVTKMDAELDRLGAELMAQDSSITNINDAKDKIKANAAVMLAAKNATEQDPTEVKTLLTGADIKGDILKTLDTDPGKAMSQAALAYGMYTAYAYNTGDADLIESTKNPISILNGLQDPGFQAYMSNTDNSGQVDKDLEAYMAALNMVNGSTSDLDTVSQIMVNGFDDPELVAVLQQAMASGK